MIVPERLQPGQRVARLPGGAINAGIEAREEQLREPRFTKPTGRGKGGGGGTTPQLVRVYDDLAGLGTVRCLPVSSGDETVGDTDADFITVKPWEGATLALNSTACCDDGIAAPGLTVNLPAQDSGSIAVTGQGVAEFATVTVTISDGSTDLTPSVTNNGDGTFTAASQSLASLSDGLVSIEATDGATTETVAIQYYSSAPSPRPLRPDALDLQAGSDSGASSSDNRTDDTTPTFDITTKDGPDATGPRPVLIVDGASVAYDETGGVNYFIDNGLTGPLTVTTALAEGRHTVQGQLWFDDTVDSYSETSPVLRIVIDSDATGAEEATRTNRAGLIASVTVAGTKEDRLIHLGACPKENTSAENTKLDA